MSSGAEDGGRRASDMLPTLYEQLRTVARRYQRDADATLQPTVLVHEVWMRMRKAGDARVRSRAHFLAMAAQAMRQVLIDYARRQQAARRNQGWTRVSVGGLAEGPVDLDILALHESLEQLEGIDARDADIVKMRYFAGMTTAEVAQVLEVSTRSVEKRWRSTRAWLLARLADRDPS